MAEQPMADVVPWPGMCTVAPAPGPFMLRESERITLEVTTKNREGIACGIGGDVIEASLELVAGPQGEAPPRLPPIEVNVVDNNDGTYGVSFDLLLEPAPAGMCHSMLTISVNGHNIGGSPFAVPLNTRTLHRNLSPNILRPERPDEPSSYIEVPQQGEHVPVAFHGIAVSRSGTIFVCDVLGLGKIHVFSKEQTHKRSFQILTQQEWPGERKTCPRGLSVDLDEQVYVAACETDVVKVFTEHAEQVRNPIRPNLGYGQFKPRNVTIHDSHIYIVSMLKVAKFTLQGVHVHTIHSPSAGELGEFEHPTAVAFSPRNAGDMYVANRRKNNRGVVLVFAAADDRYQREFGEDRIDLPTDMVITIDGHVLVAQESGRITIFSTAADGNRNDFVRNLNVPQGPCLGLAIDIEGRLLATEGHYNQRVAVYRF